MPNGPDLHQVGRSATQDEQGEHPKNPVEGKIAPLAYQIDQSKRYAVIREGDDAVRDDVQPDDLRVPQVAGPVWQEAGSKQLP